MFNKHQLTFILSGPRPGDGHFSRYVVRSWSINSNTSFSCISPPKDCVCLTSSSLKTYSKKNNHLDCILGRLQGQKACGSKGYRLEFCQGWDYFTIFAFLKRWVTTGLKPRKQSASKMPSKISDHLIQTKEAVCK